MNILFSINAKFIDLTKTCIRSIIRFDKNIDFYILYHDLHQKHMDDLKSIIKSLDKNAFMVVNETKFVENGFFK